MRSLLRADREIELGQSAGLAGIAAYALARTDDFAGAADRLERGRVRLLSDALALDLDALPDEYVAAVGEVRGAEAAAARLAATPRSDADQEQEFRRRAEQEARRRMRTARAEDCERAFHALGPPAAEGVVDRPVTYLLATAHGGLALMQDAETVPIWAPRLPEVLPHARRVLEIQSAGWGARRQRELAAALDAALPILGEELCAPLAEALRASGAHAVALVPCGLLGALPIQAAPYDGGRCLADEFVVSYAPSRTVLARTSARAARRRDRTALVAVSDATGTLPFAEAEVADTVTRLGERAIALPGDQATRARVADALRDATHAHFASHGRTYADRPLASHLRLAGDDQLTLADLLSPGAQDGPAFELPKARVVFASACQTAVIEGARIPDEMVGLAAGFLEAGVPGFIGTLWPVGDLASALFTARLYELVFPDGDATPLPPDAAVNRAGTWLRDLDGAGITAALERHPAIAERAGPSAVYARRFPERRFFDAFTQWASHVFVGAAQVEEA